MKHASTGTHNVRPLKFTIALSITFVVGVLALFIYHQRYQTRNEIVRSYKECVSQGYPVTQSFPTVCQAPNGPSYVNPAEGPRGYEP